MAEQYKFPDELEDDKSQKVEIQTEEDVEIEIVDDTPEKDRGRRPLDREVEDPTDDEIESYTQGAQKRIKELTHARHDERRAKESLLREKQELERLAQHYVEENKKLKQYVHTGTEQYGVMAKTAAEAELDKARQEYKVAQEAFDTDAIIAAQEKLFEAKIKLQNAQNFRPPALQEENYEVQPRQQAPEPVRADEKTLRWQAKNQWFGTDGFEEVTSFALGHWYRSNDYASRSSVAEESVLYLKLRLHYRVWDRFGFAELTFHCSLLRSLNRDDTGVGMTLEYETCGKD